MGRYDFPLVKNDIFNQQVLKLLAYKACMRLKAPTSGLPKRQSATPFRDSKAAFESTYAIHSGYMFVCEPKRLPLHAIIRGTCGMRLMRGTIGGGSVAW